MNIQLADIWIASGVLIGFQVYSFAWRISREAKVGQQKDITWLPPADILNLLSMIVATIGVFVLSILGLIKFECVKFAFGLAVILYVGYPFALAGHYEPYNRKTPRSFKYFPVQEKVAVILIVFLTAFYVIFHSILG